MIISRIKKSIFSQTSIPRFLKVKLRNNKKKFFNAEYTAKEDKLIYYIKLI